MDESAVLGVPAKRSGRIDPASGARWLRGTMGVLVFLGLAVGAMAQTTLWTGYMASGRQAFQSGRFGDAAELFLAASEQFDEASAAKSPRYAESLYELGRCERRQGEREAATGHLEEALAIFEIERGTGAPETASAMVELAGARRESGLLDEADSLLRRAMAIREATVAPTDPAMIEVLEEASLVAIARGRYTEAETTYRRVLAAASATYPADSPERALVLMQMAEIYAAQEKYDRALPFLRRAQGGLPADQHGPVLAAMARVYFAQDDRAQAETFYRQAVESFGRRGTASVVSAEASYRLGELLRQQDRYEEAEPFFEIAMAEALEVYGKGSRNLIPILEDYSSLLWRTGRKIKASKIQARAKSIRVRKRKKDK